VITSTNVVSIPSVATKNTWDIFRGIHPGQLGFYQLILDKNHFFFFKPDIKVTLQITFHRFFIHHDFFFLPSTGSILWHPERPQDILRGSELEPGNAVLQGGCGKTVKLLGESSHWWSKASYYRQLRFWIGDPIELDGDSQPQRWRLTMDIQQ
jgi:hypothetical protein